MIDVRLYAVMNWSMVLDGILFWCLVLDPRPKPPARVSFGVRAALAFAVMFPQIALGAVITFAQRDLYPYYDLCGRLFPSLGRAQRSAYRRHRHLDSARDDERDRRARGDHRAQAARGIDDGDRS